MAISSIGSSGLYGTGQSLQLVSQIQAAQASQQGISSIASGSLTSTNRTDTNDSFDRIVQFSGTSTLTLLLADQERRRKQNDITDALFALIAYQSTKDFFSNSANSLPFTVQGVSTLTQA